LVLSLLACATFGAAAAPITITQPFFNLEHRNVNSLGWAVGDFVRFGANSVVPNGDHGTTGVAIRDSDHLTRNLVFAPFPLSPNWFVRNLADDPNLYRGNWTLQFSNGADTATAAVSLAQNAQQAPFVHSITLSGTSLNPTFSWSPPPNTTVNAYRVNIYDKAIITPNNSGNIASMNLAPNVTSHTVTAADFTLPGYQFTVNHAYSIEISLIQTKDGTSNAANSNLQAIARSYADFTPNNGGGPPVNLPVVLDNGVYKYDIAVQPGVTYYLDPQVAIGYDFQIGAGDPNFRSVLLPANIGDGLYDIWGHDAGGQLTELAHDWHGGNVFDFGAAGVDFFRILGIETSAALDPNNTTAFVTGVTFTGRGGFTGTQTPITANVDVPEPPALALAGLALFALSLVRRRT